MLEKTTQWSHPHGNSVVPSSWQMTLPNPNLGEGPDFPDGAGLINRTRLTALADPAQHVDTTESSRSHRARWPPGLARNSKPSGPRETAPTVESDASCDKPVTTFRAAGISEGPALCGKSPVQRLVSVLGGIRRLNQPICVSQLAENSVAAVRVSDSGQNPQFKPAFAPKIRCGDCPAVYDSESNAPKPPTAVTHKNRV